MRGAAFRFRAPVRHILPRGFASLRDVASLRKIVAAAATFGLLACATEPPAETGDDAELKAGTCKVTEERTKKAMTAAQLKALKDPVGVRILTAAGGCPEGFDEIQNKLRKTDADTSSCKDDATKPPAGVDTRFVSEDSQVSKKASGYRAVVSRTCNGRSNHELLVSMFGVTAAATKLPQDVELIGFDKTAGVFNYYAREGGAWKFFGNSKDLIGDGYDCNADGACAPKARTKTRCAGCHVGGGLIMKEFDSPWVHWEHFTDTPGVTELMERFKMTLGASKTDGLTMEGATRNGNSAWQKSRIAFLKTKSVTELLRPLFCTVDFNLQSGNSSTFSTPSSIRGDFFLDPRMSGFDSVPIETKDYEALVVQFNQRVGALKGADGKPIRDTIFAFTYPERGTSDIQYVDALIEAKVIDEDFASDVVSMDFTRPIFSPVRCGLLAAAPTLAGAAITPEGIRKGFADKLKTSTAAGAAELAAKLADLADTQKHKDRATAFMDACKKRAKKDVLTDVFTYANQLRRKARAAPIQVIEFAESMTTDDIAASAKFFDGATCLLK